MNRRWLAVLTCWYVALSGCSLIGSSRPNPKAENVSCDLEYQPAAGSDADDLLFLASSYPYDGQQFNLSLPDVLLHMVFAPGRHLVMDARVEGATCATGSWKKGFRLPANPSSNWMLCRRIGQEAVLFEVETKWGVCTERILQGDMKPRDPGLRVVFNLPDLAGTT